MYTAFYGLREKPFALSPDPRFLYLATPHREALAHPLYGIEQGEGFISITGEVGTGKTTLCRTLLEQLEDDVQLAFLFNPSRSALELLQSICAEFGLPAEGLGRRSLTTQLNQFLLDQKRAGRRVLLIIDEAQTLTEDTLEQVRLLSNLETSREKLIQILLLGQPELDRKLDERGLRQLRQRISVRWRLDALGPQETRAYVRHRLAVAAGELRDLFTEAALRDVHRRTGGIPRLVNQLCDRALLAGYAARVTKIGPRIIRAAAREIPDTRRPGEGARPAGAPGRDRPWLFALASAVLVIGALAAGVQYGQSRSASNEVASNSSPWATEPPPLAELIGFVPEEVLPREVGLDALRRGPMRPVGSPPVSGMAAELSALPGARGVAKSVDGPDFAPPITDADLARAESALAPGLLGSLLRTRSASAALAETRDVLLERFGRRVPQAAPAPRDEEALRQAVEDRGLVTTIFEGGSLALLRRLNHPVALPLTASSRELESDLPEALRDPPRWITLVGFEGDRARLAGVLNGQILSVPIDELESHWLETGLIVWERFESVPNLISMDDAGPSVLWLQRILAELRYYEGSPSRRFDEATREAVQRFQRDRGLVDDGLAGPLTQIALYGDVLRYPVPRLSVSSTHEHPLEDHASPASGVAPGQGAELEPNTRSGARG